MEIIEQQRTNQKHNRGQQDNRQKIPGQLPDFLISSRQQSRRTSRGMCSASQLHNNNSHGSGERSRQPAEGLEARLVRHQTEELGDADTDQGTEEVAEDQRARLGEGAFDCAEDKHGGCTLFLPVSHLLDFAGSPLRHLHRMRRCRARGGLGSNLSN